MTKNQFAGLTEKMTFENVKEHLKKSPLDMALYGVGIGAAGWAMDAYGAENALLIIEAATAAVGLPLIAGLSIRWACNCARGRRTPFVGASEFRYLRRLLQTACNVFAWCASKLGRPAAAAVALLLGAIVGMTPGEVVKTANWAPMTAFTVAYPPPVWQSATAHVEPFSDYGRSAKAAINMQPDYPRD
ncbi:hypothetical protein [Methylobacterium oryzae]|uniref:Uncharacterized protein n=1 Tax=Methylobacterium oryzae TaxID=334852 RepID=A0ABU7TVD3_9HYPH